MMRRFIAKKDILFDNFKKLHFSMYKRVLGVNKTTNSMKVLAKLKRKPLSINTETQVLRIYKGFISLIQKPFFTKFCKRN